MPPGGTPLSSESTSSSLLGRLKDYDSDAWDELVQLYGPMVYAWCRRAGLTEADISDVAQNVFSSVFQKIGQFRREGLGDTFRGWLWKITRNEVLMLFRQRHGKAQAAGGSEAQQALHRVPRLFESEEAPATTGTQVNLVRRAVLILRGDFEEHVWNAFWRTTVDGRPAPEVADELGMTPVAIRQAKHRVLKRLRDFLAED